MPNKCNTNHVIKYIGRYLGRPVIATSRIDSYDGDSVMFHYNRHEDDKLITETIPVLDFISRKNILFFFPSTVGENPFYILLDMIL